MSTETISANAPAAVDGLPAARRGWAAAAIFTALAMASRDTAIANTALPTIAADLHVGPADVIWMVNVYQIALVATLLPLAALGEIVGHHRIYLGGLLLFTVASLACAWGWSLPSLLIARVLQGLGACGAGVADTPRWWSRPPSPWARRSPPAFSQSGRGAGCLPSTFPSALLRS